jgi:hypothetical protein
VLVAALVALAVRLRARIPHATRRDPTTSGECGVLGEMQGVASSGGGARGGSGADARGGRGGHIYGSMPASASDVNSPL